MDNKTPSERQGFLLLLLFMLGNLITAGGAKALADGWLLLLMLIPVSVALFMLYLYVVGNRAPWDVFPSALGKTAGTLLNILYCVLALLMAGDSIRLFADFIVINDLNDAGAWGNTAIMSLLVLMMLYTDLQAQGRAARILCPMTVVFLLFGIVITIGKMDIGRLLPLFDHEKTELFRGFSGSIVGILVPVWFPLNVLEMNTTLKWKKSVFAAGATACTLLALLSFRDCAVLGFPALQLFRFPGFTAAGIVRHSEVLLSAAFMFSQPFRTAFCLRYVYACLTSLRPHWKKFYPPILLAIAIASGILSWSSEQVRWRTTGEIFVLMLMSAAPVAAAIAKRYKAYRHKSLPDA